ncbi:hypothetical protein SPYCA_3228 [Sphingopyxis sp. FD7]|nr:hypothetical protein SPYCA_3228 [Sphingopyxis sp. FD7]
MFGKENSLVTKFAELCAGLRSKTESATRDSSALYWRKSTFSRFIKKMLVTVCGHPARPRQMVVMDLAGTIRLGVGIEAEDNARHLAPVSSFIGCIKYP